MLRLGIAGAAALGMMVGSSAVALADLPPYGGRVASGATADTEALIRQAEAARRAGRAQDAEAAYRAAWEAARAPVLAGELGSVELAQGKHRDAAEHLRLGLAQPDALAPAVRARFQRELARAQQEVATVAIAVNRPAAEVFVDGRRVGQGLATYVTYVDPGNHEARAKLAGYVDEVWRFDAQRGDRPMVGLQLKPVPAASRGAPPSGPRAAVAPAPPASSPSSAGPAIRIVGIGLSSTAVVLGAGFAIAAAVKSGEAESYRTEILRGGGGTSACLYPSRYAARCDALRSLVNAEKTFETAAWATFGAGALIGGFALSSLWWAPSPPAVGEVRVVPQASARGGGMWLEGAW